MDNEMTSPNTETELPLRSKETDKKQKKILEDNLSREVIMDKYVASNLSSIPTDFQYKVFIRLNAKKISFKNISFIHCIFENCYINACTFDSCDFTGCKFIGCNFHQTAFAGCKFDYAIFERSQFDDDILTSEAPIKENLRMRFARSLRMNYQQIGDAKAVNKAISLELAATSEYLHKSWRSDETYYRKKYSSPISIGVQFFKWLEFWILDFIWGNGESILKLLRSIVITLIMIAVYDTNSTSSPATIGFLLRSLVEAPAIFLGVLIKSNFSITAAATITAARLISIALLTALLVKRFSRR